MAHSKAFLLLTQLLEDGSLIPAMSTTDTGIRVVNSTRLKIMAMQTATAKNLTAALRSAKQTSTTHALVYLEQEAVLLVGEDIKLIAASNIAELHTIISEVRAERERTDMPSDWHHSFGRLDIETLLSDIVEMFPAIPEWDGQLSMYNLGDHAFATISSGSIPDSLQRALDYAKERKTTVKVLSLQGVIFECNYSGISLFSARSIQAAERGSYLMTDVK